MITVQSWLTPRDNAGAQSVECIRALGGFSRTYAYPGDFVLVAIKSLRLIRKVKVGEIHLALVTQTRKESRFLDGTTSRSGQNAVLLRNRKKRLLGTRFFGWISRRLRRKKFLRLMLLSGRHRI